MAKQRNSTGKDSDFVKIFEYYVNTEGIRGKTKLTPAKRNLIYVYDLMHKKHPKWGLSAAAENLAHLFISEDGESRRGMVELWRGLLSQLRQESANIDVGSQNNNQKP